MELRMNNVNFVFVVLAVVVWNNCCEINGSSSFFRKDYTFVEATNSHYKIHRILNTYWDAKRRCALEGATLWIPETKAEVDAVTAWWKKTLSGITYVYLGINDLISEGVFQSIDGRPIQELYNGWEEGEPYDDGEEDCILISSLSGEMNDVNCSGIHNFMCKKTSETIDWNEFCDLPDSKYMYNKDIGKCYKLHQNPKTWTDAFSICDAEQSYLAILNTQKEADIVTKFFQNSPKQNYKGKMNRDVIHLGFRYGDDEEWTTIKGVRLEDNGYAKWAENQPDNYHKSDNCGGMSPSGELHDVDCSDKCAFICEHDIAPLSLSLGERYGN